MNQWIARNWDLVIGFVLGLLCILATMGCDLYTPAAPTTVVVAEPPKDPPKEPEKPPVAVDLFCPDGAPRFTVSMTTGGLQFTFEPTISPTGAFLRRYEVELQRNNNGYSFDSMLQLEGKILSGPHNRQLVIVVKPPVNGGSYSARMRSHFPDECRGDGGLRKNGPWSEPPVLFGI